jgi:HlyD family secretion protein
MPCHPSPAPARVALSLVLLLAACRSGSQPDAYGHVEATEVVVATQASGQVRSFMPAEGARVSVGVVTAIIDTTALVLQLQQIAAQRAASDSRVDEATHQIGVLTAQRAIALRAYERTRRLFAAQAATVQQIDQTERDYRTVVAQEAAARAQRKAAADDAASSEAKVAQVHDQIAKSRVINPISGTVLTTYAKAGEFVQTGQPLYKIADLDTMELRAYVTEPQLAGVKLGQSAQVTIDVGEKERRSLAGTVVWIASQAEFTPTPIVTRDERANLVYAVKVRVPNRGGVLKIGMPADVQFAARTATR